MLDHNEKLKLVIELIQADIKDPSAITQSVKLIEKNLFKKEKLRSIKTTLKANKIKNNKETGSYARSKK